MADSYVIMFDMHADGHDTSQVAVVCSSLEKAEKWLDDEPKGKPWAKLAYVEGKGLKKRLITNFSETRWSNYYIRRHDTIG